MFYNILIKGMKFIIKGTALFIMLLFCNCQQKSVNPFSGASDEVKLITLNPGHFHAALIQKEMYEQVDSKVNIYAPEGADLNMHLERIDDFNSRADNPTNWQNLVYTGNDYLQKMINDKKGNVVVLAGNNKEKTAYIKSSVEAGLNVLSDKPMVIDDKSFKLLEEAYEIAEKNKVLLYDVMTERYEITNLLQKEITQIKELFGNFEKGSAENPAIIKESVHHLYKKVAGSVLQRPAWYFDVSQQGEGIVDVTTHLVDLIQWICFPEEILNYKNDVNVYQAKRWPTLVTKEQLLEVTGLDKMPDYIENKLDDDVLPLYANGEMSYSLKDIHARVIVTWDFEAPEGGGDTHMSLLRGSKSNLIIKQGVEEGFIPVLYIEPAKENEIDKWFDEIEEAFKIISDKYQGIQLLKNDIGFEVDIPSQYRIGHEAHFAKVVEKYLQFLVDGKLPDWEIPNILAKYYTTTKALEIAQSADE